LQEPSPNSQAASFKNLGVSRLISSKLSKEEKILTIAQDAGPGFQVLIVDRDSMSSDLLADALVRDCRCAAAAIQPSDLLHALSVSEVDLVVIGAELSSKSGDGFDLAYTVCRAHPNTYVVILLNQATHESVIKAFRSGARGVFSRQQPMADFLDCVEHVRKGFIWAGREATNSLLEAFQSIPAPSLVTATDSPTLTARELQVVQYAAKGKTNKTIACELGLSEHTVKNYLFRAFEKLGVSSRVELLFYLTLRGHTFSATKADGIDIDTGIERAVE
jgi:two-component system nitrate/nitrite response regulator NarL